MHTDLWVFIAYLHMFMNILNLPPTFRKPICHSQFCHWVSQEEQAICVISIFKKSLFYFSSNETEIAIFALTRVGNKATPTVSQIFFY